MRYRNLDSDSHAARRSSHRSLLIVLTIAFAIHAFFIRDGFLTDDFVHLLNIQTTPFANAVWAPDAFGFYRPVQQATYWLEDRLFHSDGAEQRAVNLGLHLAVVTLAFVLGRRVLGGGQGAFVAALVFVLAPKANTIAVTWISARAELLMTFFVLLSLVMWTRWIDRPTWLALAACAVCYVFAILSKEAAILLPVVAACLPAEQETRSRRFRGALVLMAVGVAVFVARTYTGALMPSSPTSYNMLTPISVWTKNTWNYFGRALPAPAAVVSLSVLTALATRGTHALRDVDRAALWPSLLVAAVWFVAFVAPSVPVMPRSEIRIYLPDFAPALAAGACVQALERAGARSLPVVLAICIALFGTYEVMRGREAAANMTFSRELVAAIRGDARIAQHRGTVVIVPATPTVAQSLRDTIGGYLGRTLRRLLSREDIDGDVTETVPSSQPGTLVLTCTAESGVVRLR